MSCKHEWSSVTHEVLHASSKCLTCGISRVGWQTTELENLRSALAQTVADREAAERETVEAIVSELRTKYILNRNAQEWADWIERGDWRKP